MRLWKKIACMTVCFVLVLTARSTSVRADVPAVQAQGDFEYTVERDGTWITKYTGSAKEVIIPSTLGGQTVVGIKQHAFWRVESMTRLILNEGLKTLQGEAVAFCEELEYIYFPSTYKFSIDYSFMRGGGGSFHDNEKLATLEVSSANKNVVVYDGALYTADYETLILYPSAKTDKVLTVHEGTKYIADDSCRENNFLEKVIMPDTVEYIGFWSFIHDINLSDVSVSKGCTAIGQFAFQETGLETITIPASVEWIGDSAFTGTSKLTAYIVESGNKWFRSENGVLYVGDTLVAYPIGKTNTSFEVKKGIKKISTDAFYRAENLRKVVLPEGLEIIDRYAFSDCYYLQEINLPDSLTEIGCTIFSNIFEDIYFSNLPYSLEKLSVSAFKADSSITFQENFQTFDFVGCDNIYHDIARADKMYFCGGVPEGLDELILANTSERIWETFWTVEKPLTIYYPADDNSWMSFIAACSSEAVQFAEHTHSSDGKEYEHYVTLNDCHKIKCKHCKVCGGYYDVDYVLPTHTPDLENYTPEKPPTCKETGTVAYYACTDAGCNAKVDEYGYEITDLTIPKTEHIWRFDIRTFDSSCAKSHYTCAVCGEHKSEVDTGFTSLAKAADGNWYDYVNGVVSSYTGLRFYNGSWWYVNKGKLNFNATTLCQYGGTWWYVQGGKVNFNATTLCQYGGTWWYVQGGKVNFNATTLCQYSGSWWYIQNGKVNFNATTLCQYSGSWWYVQNGKVNFNATTLCQYSGSWWYVQKGKVNFNATTLCQYGGSWWYVQKGKVNFNATTLCQYSGSWWYVQGGKVNFGATTLCKYNGKWWYVQKGKVNFGYNGYVMYAGSRWYVKNGVMQYKA